MTSFEDIIKKDSDIKGLNIIFDEKIMIENINQYFGIKIEKLKMTYIRYHPHDRCIVNYDISTFNTKLNIYAKAQKKSHNYCENKSQLNLQLDKYDIQGRFGIDQNVELCSIHYDKNLDSLRSFVTREKTKKLLIKLFPKNKEFWGSQIDILLYMPEKRLVTKLTSQQGKKIVLKFCKRNDFIKFNNTMDALQSINFPIQRKFHSSSSFKSIAYEWIEGKTLYDILCTEFDLGNLCLHDVGIALARFHKLKIKDLSRNLSYSEKRIKPPNLKSIADQINYIYPKIYDRTISATKKLISIIPPDSLSFQNPIHGDFSAKNIIVNKNMQIYFIDLDESSIGNNLIDISKFIAYLNYWVIIDDINKKDLPQLIGTFLNSYKNTIKHEISDHVLQIYVNLQLFTLLRNPFRLCLKNWKIHTNNILKHVEFFLDTY